MTELISQQIPRLYKCPRCKIKSGQSFNFGKKARCLNCNHIWKIIWRGAKIFTNKNRNELK